MNYLTFYNFFCFPGYEFKTGATILCVFVIRLGRKERKIVITPPIPASKTGNREEDVYQITKAFMKTIEDNTLNSGDGRKNGKKGKIKSVEGEIGFFLTHKGKIIRFKNPITS